MSYSIDPSKIRSRQELDLQAARDAARSYLAETDWMIVRRAETQKSVAREVLDRRKAARLLLGTDD